MWGRGREVTNYSWVGVIVVRPERVDREQHPENGPSKHNTCTQGDCNARNRL